MGKRIVSGAAVMILAVAALLAGGTWLAAALLVISCIAYRELCRATGVHGKTGMGGLEAIGYICILLYYFLLWQEQTFSGGIFGGNMQLFLFMLLIVSLMLLMAVYVLTFPRYTSEQVMAAFFCMIYGPVMLSFIYLTECMQYGIYIVWMIFISSWVCDTCAYFTGVTLGKHKMAPVLSPKKSIEGAVGGVAGSALAGALFAFFIVERAIPDRSVIWAFAALGGIGAVISQIGDLAASAIKRNHDIKDYGTCIPGHGGIMDRFDSVIFTAPVIYFMARILIGA
ncbi:MAG: phosphatidate cytidylyltransferase [Lachnospiraceae bacterium]|jgi:phosphatidate cytidylyltransferase|nr:phosphatidate cytidylyltransferase [Lachnospiraceae bacterium]